ncbi:TolC family protein [Spirosoma agri]|uniref:TolC family protein n=1 Tax=Spirosoma agri TaxID=1987381 RepID=A0A6M0IRE7_9BACT|nr:TolC family protein [Spirosoma agri]NEU70888.1 TolC family protein [Spirosoma agri]
MKRVVILIGVWIGATSTWAQSARSLTLEECYVLAQENYPLSKQRALIQKTRDYSVANAAKGYLPQLAFSGQATYQSQTIDFSESPLGSLPLGASLPKISKDQYKVTGQIDQVIYDGGVIQYTQQTRQSDAVIQEQNLNVNLYALRDRVNNLFFGLALIEEQRKLADLRKSDIQQGVDRTQGALANGTSFRSNLNELKAELIRVDQNTTELNAMRRAYVTMLGALINQTLDENTTLIRPQSVTLSTQINRPELILFESQKRIYDVQENQLRAASRPKVSAFFQENYGRPTFNIINNTVDFFWMGGIRINWALSSFYTTRRNDRQLLNVNRQQVDVQRETFLFNTNLSMVQQRSDVQKYQELIEQDNQIVELRSSVKTSANAQLQNGVITTHDYIAQVNAENEARQSLALHQIQLLQVQYNHKTTSGN